jgi:hypothetical protein
MNHAKSFHTLWNIYYRYLVKYNFSNHSAVKSSCEEFNKNGYHIKKKLQGPSKKDVRYRKYPTLGSIQN